MDKNNSDSDGDILKVINSLECSNKQCLHCKDGIETITSTIRSTLLEINDIQERNRERRHREIVSLFEKYFNNDECKAYGTLANVKLENSLHSSNPTDNKHSAENIEHTQFSNRVEKIDVAKRQERKQSVDIRKRRASLTENATDIITTKKPTETLNNIKVEAISCATPIGIEKGKPNQRDELTAMREKMLAIQRRKMEDRERKKRENNAM